MLETRKPKSGSAAVRGLLPKGLCVDWFSYFGPTGRLLFIAIWVLLAVSPVAEQATATDLWDLRQIRKISRVDPNHPYATAIQKELVRIGCLKDEALTQDGDWQVRSVTAFNEFARRLTADFGLTYQSTATYEDVLGLLKNYETTAWVNATPAVANKIVGDDCARAPVGKSRCDVDVAGPAWLKSRDVEVLGSAEAKQANISLGLQSLRDALESVETHYAKFVPDPDPVVYFRDKQSATASSELKQQIADLKEQLGAVATIMAVGKDSCRRCRLQQAYNKLRRYARTFPPAKGQSIDPDVIATAAATPELAEKIRFESIDFAMIDRVYKDIQDWHTVRAQFEAELIQNYKFDEEAYELANALLADVVVSLIKNRPSGAIDVSDQPLAFEDDFRTYCRGFADDSK